ncbi:glutaredoxin [Trichophyton rubrum D6]|uniref:Glutaredoxin n=3 Tax=Trichophyton TaxID=5550 RepID=F2SLI1_TRIRC|nr:glutaredoxin [Trichophyton rubrum CBS 118892]EZF21985.1 glutaredoxin [Trichophyton rubrum MR850]EZF40866.1 glutaredoxin [Trichophyton rubrum CBS 100081]EZF51660.1 glutaredoxin [Trichophyton rubrum CBS 288.86]EZF62196.1 glutaredoxin [Trichophyton rubrum CBS 289.86]EZF72906.1 glutaredoxin [Trichophyton soudanense CBS 452.61]EZF83620.1 glutaredoxin [Trichophyton rubrum MR1448]EZF94273.1 glutaredoxin [Trichophyton rubrum MR1459]EZG05248.1 glutaredoxin [Trichophyton rubrum CBS 735.88]EZG1579
MFSPRRLRLYLISAVILGDVRRTQALRAAGTSQLGKSNPNLKGSSRDHGNDKDNDGGVFDKLKPGALRPGDKQKTVKVEEPEQTPTSAKKGKGDGKDEEEATDDTKSEDEIVNEEMNTILKRSPIIIFSKSYCPYSKKAKYFMLEKYNITPAPFVVELDEHPLGRQLQDLLGTNTGRRTVPNILVNGKTIGGGDDIESLYLSGDLGTKLQALGGKRVTAVPHSADPDP